MSAVTRPPQFVLWREVLFAYLAPAICAGAGGLITGRLDLMLAALTSIAGTSAAVALALGILLQRGLIRRRRLPGSTPMALSAMFGIAAGALGAALARLLTMASAFPERIRADVPIAAALAATIITWRWCSTHRREDK
ncbi:hypothetical protein ACFXPS_42490 [Nocardia sp. NPDC059091]|uniref:hypothetical protein n=1 Tax=unclassified Nocardia TaxID=2637762 RepID=UPI0036B6D361